MAGGREAKEGGDIYTQAHIADSFCYTAETNIIL